MGIGVPSYHNTTYPASSIHSHTSGKTSDKGTVLTASYLINKSYIKATNNDIVTCTRQNQLQEHQKELG